MVNGSVVRFGYSATSNPRPVLARHAMHDESQPGRGSARTRPSRDACHSRCKSYQDSVSLFIDVGSRYKITIDAVHNHQTFIPYHHALRHNRAKCFILFGSRHKTSEKRHCRLREPAPARASGQPRTRTGARASALAGACVAALARLRARGPTRPDVCSRGRSRSCVRALERTRARLRARAD